MSSIENPQGGEGLDERLCSYVYPEGHEKAGQQCQGYRGAAGYCGGHARAMGLTKPREDRADAPSSGPQSMAEHAAALAAVSGSASASLDRLAATFLDDPRNQRMIMARWREILETGVHSDAIRLLKELMDRVYGRAGEAQAEPELVVPPSIEALRALSPEERRALLMADHRAQQH